MLMQWTLALPWLVNTTLKGLTGAICRVDDAQLARVPQHGPLIVVANHINFLDAPVLFSRVHPRRVTGFVKAETWQNPTLAMLFDMWKTIPLERGEADVGAFREGLAALQDGAILAVAPEGTRSGHGRLQRGRPGVVLLALHSGAPVLPLVYYGGERFHDNLRSLRRTDFRIIVGQPFYLDARGVKVTRTVRHAMIDEMMYQIAGLLPPDYRGVYADIDAATEHYLRFPEGSVSNLPSSGTMLTD
ncbi:MAG: 1-acyl-sn-glycerol-3-phosphate acyltransferase [Anaerolineae bacterium]|nr:1-acyl-sn-glycerol-3-phosphate acyltransferase [Anaerolineae bacterium]